MPEDIDLKLLDKRVVARYLEKGRLAETDYEKHLRSLPDLAESAVPIESDLDSTDLDDEDEPEEMAPAGEQEPAPHTATPAQPVPQAAAPAQAAPQVAPTQVEPAPQGSEPAPAPVPPAPEPQGT